MKKFVALLMAVLMCGLLFCACTGAKNDLEYVQEKGTLIVGITEFKPMDWQEDGEWVGFDAEMARKFAEYLGVEVEYIEINWDNKAMELETKSIDVVWNGMTITDEVKGLMGVGDAYCKNAQVVVVKADIAANIKTVDDIKSLTFAVENGSAGAKALDAEGITYTACDTQAKALLEVNTGASQACVIDLLMAGAMIGEGSDYPDLTTTISLNSEEYGVGFRKDSELIEEFNEFWKANYDSGTVMEMAEKYGIAKNIIEK